MRPSFLLERLSELTMPVSVIVGREDLPRPVSESEIMAEKISTSELTIIENAAHICNVEQPDKVNLVLKKFLAAAFVEA